MIREQEETILQIPVGSIRPNPYQPRKVFTKTALVELCESIKVYGILQPINVRKMGEDSYELVAGERRLRAAKLAELETVPAIVVNISDHDSAVLALIENLQREDLNFLEEAEGYFHLLHDHNFTQQDVAHKVGKNQSTIANKLRILKLTPEIKSMLLEHKLTERHARALLKLPDENLQMEILQHVIKKDYNVKKTEKLIAETLDKLSKPKGSERRQNIKSSINFKIYINTLKNAFNAIKDTGLNAEYKQLDKGDYVEVIVKIPKT